MPRGFDLGLKTFIDVSLALTLTESGCLIWPHGKQHGYGCISWHDRSRRVHRLLYEARYGPVPSKMHLHHKCENPACANLDHLVLLTAGEHTKVGRSISALNAQKTHCPRGHSYAEHAIPSQLAKGIRRCGICDRNRDRGQTARREQRRLAALAAPLIDRRRATCRRGHPLAGENLYLAPAGKRRCRICQGRWSRNYRERRGRAGTESECAREEELL